MLNQWLKGMAQPTAGGGFTPADLFANSEEGVWYEPSDTTCFTDISGTIAAGEGDAVAYVEDLSGNGNHLTQSTVSKQPTLEKTVDGLWYLDFDGSDTMNTAAINLTGTSRVTTFMRVEKNSDTAVTVLAEFSTTVGNDGTFLLAANTSGGTDDWHAETRGTVNQKSVSNDSQPSLVTLTGIHYIDAPETTLRVNGSQIATNTSSAGPRNFTSASLYVSGRGGSSFFLSGKIFGLIVRGAESTATEIDSTEAYLAYNGEPYTPEVLFQDNEEGAWYEPSDTTCFTDISGTTPAGVGDKVAYMTDLSGNGHHVTQATVADQPTLEQDANGNWYLDFNGSEYLKSTVGGMALTGQKMSAFIALTKNTDIRMFPFLLGNAASDQNVGMDINGTIFAEGNGAYCWRMDLNNGQTISDFAADSTTTNYLGVSTNVLSVDIDRGLTGNDKVSGRVDGSPFAGTTSFTGTDTLNPTNFGAAELVIGWNVALSNGRGFDGRLYGMIIRNETSTAIEIDSTEAYLADLSGVTL